MAAETSGNKQASRITSHAENVHSDKGILAYLQVLGPNEVWRVKPLAELTAVVVQPCSSVEDFPPSADSPPAAGCCKRGGRLEDPPCGSMNNQP
jgi:hypothetical protein